MRASTDAVRAVSSAVEHCLHTARVTGSIPVPPTISKVQKSPVFQGFFAFEGKAVNAGQLTLIDQISEDQSPGFVPWISREVWALAWLDMDANGSQCWSMPRRRPLPGQPRPAHQVAALALFEGVPDVPASTLRFFALLAAAILAGFAAVMTLVLLGVPPVWALLLVFAPVLFGLRLPRAVAGLVVHEASPPARHWLVMTQPVALQTAPLPGSLAWPVAGLERPPRLAGAV